MNGSQNKKKLGVLDYFIIIALIAVLACLAVRYLITGPADESPILGNQPNTENYIISFKVSGIRDTTPKNYMKPGSKFYCNGVYIGSLLEGLTVSDAKTSYTKTNGQRVICENNAVGDLYRVDVEAQLGVSGLYDSNGIFLAEGKTRLAKNQSLAISSKYVTFTVLITDITKAQ